MEPLTHTLTGYMMSRAGLRNWCPLATPVLLMAANVPDIDFVSLLGDDLLVLDWHRGPTHALSFLCLMAALPLAPMWLLARRRMRWGRAYAVSLLGVLSHLALDWTNIFGVRLLEPFNRRYFHLDITAVVDLWLLGVLSLAAAWFVISRLVSSEIGDRRASGRGVALAALAFVVLWQAGRYALHQRALLVLDSRIYDGEAPRRVAALPHVASPLHWTGLVETKTAYRVFEIDLTGGSFDPAGGRTFHKPEFNGAMQAARRTSTFERYFRFLEYPIWLALPAGEPDGATRVQVMDMRFGWPGEERFVATATVDREGRVVEESFQFDPPGHGPRLR